MNIKKKHFISFLKLPKENLINLKKYIEEIFKSIEDQKKLIMNELLNIIIEIENIMKQDIHELNNMKEEYNKCIAKRLLSHALFKKIK